MDQTELWYFGIFDALIGDKVTKYMQSYFFDKKLQEVIYQFVSPIYIFFTFLPQI